MRTRYGIRGRGVDAWWAGVHFGFAAWVPHAGGLCGERPVTFPTKRSAEAVRKTLGLRDASVEPFREPGAERSNET